MHLTFDGNEESFVLYDYNNRSLENVGPVVVRRSQGHSLRY